MSRPDKLDRLAMVVLLYELLGLVRPLLDPERCSPFASAWEFSGMGAPGDIDGEAVHAALVAKVAEFDAFTNRFSS